MPVCELSFPLSTHGFLVSMLRNSETSASPRLRFTMSCFPNARQPGVYNINRRNLPTSDEIGAEHARCISQWDS